ncbi:MAG: NAD-glutamate dehydrogenase [Panacagrimonas sp.]
MSEAAHAQATSRTQHPRHLTGDRDWIQAYREQASPAVLASRAQDVLSEVALRHRDHFRQRPAGTDALLVEAARTPGMSCLMTCVDDRPFMVDTTLMVLRDAGLAVDWLIHPVLRVQRDGAGRLEGLAPAGSGHAESWIYVEFEGVLDAAAAAQLGQQLHLRLAQLRAVVGDFGAMRARLQELVEELAHCPPGIVGEEVAEAREFLRWLDADRFTFIACSESITASDASGRAGFQPRPEAGLGLARDHGPLADTEALIAPREELDKYVESPRVVVVTKALRRAPIHHDEPLDVISVKRFDAQGRVNGLVRFVGLFAAEAYQEAPWVIPLIRRKCQRVLDGSRLDLASHSGKALAEILGGFPRDELFQSGEDELLRTCIGILDLPDRQQLRLFMRRDRYGRFFSALVYIPRERYSRELRDRIGQELLLACGGQGLDRTVEFLRGGFARIRFQVRTPPGTVLDTPVEAIEQRLLDATRPFRDQLRAALAEHGAAEVGALTARFGEAFTPAYLERTAAADVAADTVALAGLDAAHPVHAALRLGAAPTRLKLFCWREPLALADVLPVLQNFGIRSVRQDPEPVRPRDGDTLWVQDFEVEIPPGSTPEAARELETLLPQVLRGAAEDDGLNRLVLAAALSLRQIVVLRVLARYVNQIGLPYGRTDIERILAANADVARLLVQQFEARFDPAIDAARRSEMEAAGTKALDEALDQVAGLDADRILRALVSVVRAGLRTNFWQRDADGRPKPWVSLKLDPSKVPELPQPRPLFEIWVCSPTVEGVHLRGGKVARGGLRWSDRSEDFRTEVLGLMKAQQVKNVVIVPVGAKGGFVTKKSPPPAEREAWMAYGIECYRTFLRGLLDLTDNRVGDGIVAPRDTVRHDGDDPYLVVAADKGTATFSDIANGVAADYGFWLGDAFASGGSVGYDHKKMGITARGAWESVKRHFRELKTDIAREDFTVVGIGDMSGDVFGNGMLLSPHIRLVAAFDHRHVFLDPSPDPQRSFAERQRLFALPRSSWADYDTSLISKGGGVFARSAKRVTVSPEAAQALGIAPGTLAPAELIRACLRAPVDLLWNGGIGTYVKASSQGNDQVRDRGNDAVRVDGRELRARVVGEGGNLGFTQAGRIEYALRGAGGHGGRINTDAIDNSGGVHCSDREVNIKIALNEIMAAGHITRPGRDRLLAAMTDDVARFVLRDNEVQSGAISLIESHAALRLDDHAALIRRLERDGRLDRALEGLPDDEEIQERRGAARGLTRPEIAVLMAYAKMSLNEAALGSKLPDDPYFREALLDNFPPALVHAHRAALEKHRLRREIVATLLSNAVVNRMGASFAHRLAEDQGASLAEVIAGYAAAHELLESDHYWRDIETLDGKLPAAVQIRLMHLAADLIKHVSGWIVGARFGDAMGVGDIVARYAPAVKEIESRLPDLLPTRYREDHDRHLSALLSENVPEDLSRRLAATKALGGALDIADLARNASVPLADAATTYLELGERLRMPWLLSALVNLHVTSHWQALARSRLREDAYLLHRNLAAQVMAAGGVDAWAAANESRLKFSLGRLTEIQASGAQDYAGLTVAVRELYDLQRT